MIVTDAAGNAKYHAINLADYVTTDDAGKWVVSIPEAAWYVHSDSCQHKNGVGHDSKTDVGCADDLYVVRLVLHLPHFASQVTQTDPTQSNCAMVEVFGVPTRSTTMALNAEFSTEYKTESWNRNTSTRTIDGDYAKMMPLTAEPELQTYFNWTGGKTNEDNYEVDAATHRPKSANKVIHETLPQTITKDVYKRQASSPTSTKRQ